MVDEQILAKLDKLKQRLIKKEEKKAAKLQQQQPPDPKPQPSQFVECPDGSCRVIPYIKTPQEIMRIRGLTTPAGAPTKIDEEGYLVLDMDADNPDKFINKVKEMKGR